MLQLGAIFPGLNWAVAYLSITIDSDREQKAELRLGSDDQAKLWLNGQLVFQQARARRFAADNDIVPVELRKGANRLLVKVCNEQGEWSFSLRLTAPNGRSLLGVTL